MILIQDMWLVGSASIVFNVFSIQSWSKCGYQCIQYSGVNVVINVFLFSLLSMVLSEWWVYNDGVRLMIRTCLYKYPH